MPKVMCPNCSCLAQNLPTDQHCLSCGGSLGGAKEYTHLARAVEFVAQRSAKGVPDEQIRGELKGSGWSDDALASVWTEVRKARAEAARATQTAMTAYEALDRLQDSIEITEDSDLARAGVALRQYELFRQLGKERGWWAIRELRLLEERGSTVAGYMVPEAMGHLLTGEEAVKLAKVATGLVMLDADPHRMAESFRRRGFKKPGGKDFRAQSAQRYLLRLGYKWVEPALAWVPVREGVHRTPGRPLHRAAGRGDAVRVLELLGKGADANADDGAGRTALHVAAEKGHADVVLVLAGRTDHAATDATGDTPLHRASERGHLDVVRHLLAHRPDVNARGGATDTPLHRAAEHGRLDVVRCLLQHGADVGVSDDGPDDTALDRATKRGHAEVVQCLLDHDPEAVAQDDMFIHPDDPPAVDSEADDDMDE